MTVQLVYRAINAITAEFAQAGIAKTHTNVLDQYQYRSIDDLLNRLAPLLAKHQLCVLPRTLERTAADRHAEPDKMLVHVTLKVAFDLVGAEDSTCHTIEAFGEALDEGDKATAKAMSAAYKAAMLQAFCIPVGGTQDADADAFKLRKRHEQEPVQGWDQWMRDIIGTIGICDTDEALRRVQDSNRALLMAISRERTELYEAIGAAFACRRMTLAAPAAASAPKRAARKISNRSGAQTQRPARRAKVVNA